MFICPDPEPNALDSSSQDFSYSLAIDFQRVLIDANIEEGKDAGLRTPANDAELRVSLQILFHLDKSQSCPGHHENDLMCVAMAVTDYRWMFSSETPGGTYMLLTYDMSIHSLEMATWSSYGQGCPGCGGMGAFA